MSESSPSADVQHTTTPTTSPTLASNLMANLQLLSTIPPERLAEFVASFTATFMAIKPSTETPSKFPLPPTSLQPSPTEHSPADEKGIETHIKAASDSTKDDTLIKATTDNTKDVEPTYLYPTLERETSPLLWPTHVLAFFYRLRPTKPLPTRDKLQSSQVTLRLFNHYSILPSKRFRPQPKSTFQRERLDHQLQREHFTRAQPPNSSFTGNTFTPFKQSTIKSFQILLQLF
jgi:hypothetical protein